MVSFATRPRASSPNRDRPDVRVRFWPLIYVSETYELVIALQIMAKIRRLVAEMK
jgi:hypothetical protein